MLINMTKIEIELILDPDMYFFIQKVMGSEVSYISRRYCNANNKYLKCYDPK